MTIKKEAIEINCSGCGARFRLWIPEELLSEWGKGEDINCIKCGARFLVKSGPAGVSVTSAAPAPAQAQAQKPPAQASGEDAGKKKVIFIDDDKLAIAIAQHSLTDLDISLVTVKSGEEALKQIALSRFDIIITDLHLKDPSDPNRQLDGEDVLNRVASLGKPIPAIITTGKDIIDDIALDPKWFDLKVRGFIQKGNPFWADELKTKLKEVLGLV
ncbi:MAG: response regulator [Deltaproteobacteria bacterium]